VVLWRRPIGRGYAAPSVSGDQVYVFHRIGDEVRLESLRKSNAEPTWVWKAATDYRDDYGFSNGPRAAPTVAAERVFVFGADGLLAAVDRATGETLWTVATASRFGVRKGFFGAAASPLVVGDRLFLNVGGATGGLVAFDTADGSVLWAVGRDRASYASAVAMRFAERDAVLFFTGDGLSIVATDDGTVLASRPWRSRSSSSVNAATPLLLDGERIFASASYGTGAILLAAAGGRLEPLWSSDDILSSHYGTAVASGNRLFGFHGRQEYGAALRAVDVSTREVLWSVERFGAGSVTLVGDRLLVLHEDGRLFLAPTSDRGFEPLAEARILEPTVRALPAYADGVLYAHNERELVAVKLR